MFTNTHTISESLKFLNEVVQYYPYKINYILTDNGSEFTDKGHLSFPKNKTYKTHPFVEKCKELDIDLRQTKFKAPWTNGMVERFNRKLKDNVIKLKFFESPSELSQDLVKYINRFNFEIKLKGLNYKAPVEFLHTLKHFDPNILIQYPTTYRY